MLLKVDHYTSLARTIAHLNRDSYRARGAVYDRAFAQLVKRLNAAVPPNSQADIDMELLAFRAAVRRVEFGDLDAQDWLAQHDEQAADLVADEVEPISSEVAEPTPSALALIDSAGRRSVFGRVAGRSLLAVLLLGIGIAGYAHATGQLDLTTFVQRFTDQIATTELPGQSEGPQLMSASAAPENATWYEQGGGATSGWTQLSGKAEWRARLEPVAGPEHQTEPVLMLDVQVPDRGFEVAMSVRRDATANAAMSHLIEFQFTGSKDFAVDAISGVMGISMKNAEDRSSTALAGLSVRVAPGVFLFGLSSDKEESQRNVELLRTQSRIEIPVAFTDGRTAMIAVDKGASGERVFTEVLDTWAQ